MEAYMIWLIVGVSCLAAEALGVTGIGLLFAGLGALTVGSIVTALPDLTHLQQGIVFFASTALWAALLWKPIQRFRGKPDGKSYQNMVGDTVFIGAAGLEAGAVGEATWSGTIMRAELSEGTPSLPPGAQAVIVRVSGNTLIVKPKI
jgi:membrane protein implicated in regulation of membrane protease activity